MEFFIKQNTTLPLLKMQIVKDGKTDYRHICDIIERSSIYFSMVDDATGIPKIISAGAGFVNKVFVEPNSLPEYYLYYRFTKNDTNRSGRYRGEFTLLSDEGTLVVPLSDILYINIPENLVSDESDDNCGEPGFPCCDDDEPLSYSFELNIIVSSGSIIVDSEIISDKPLITDATATFDTFLLTTEGDPIQVPTEVTIKQGEKIGSVQYTINGDYNNLNGSISIANMNIVFLDRSIDYSTDENSPKFEQYISDAIITEVKNEYIQVGLNIYLSYIDSPN
jgi:hypothetical protein